MAVDASSIISIPETGYDVFMSFRGKDTRNNFTSHLHAALHQKQILCFADSKHLRAGDEISASLATAIERSKLYLIVFSPNYASSKWCLLELEMILQECKKSNGKKRVIPVFYNVDPSHVRYQIGSFKEAFCKNEEREQMDKVRSWRAALSEVASVSGWDSTCIRPEATLIMKIVDDVLEKLNRLSLTYSIGLVGVDFHVEKLKSLLGMESPTSKVCSVGIWGMGGIGKTTIASAFLDRFYTLFNGFLFFSNVREELARHGVVAFWNKLISELLDEKELTKCTPSLRFSFISERLHRKRVLIVFDDVDDSVFIELQDLAMHHDLFGPGSKIIITSRDKQVLEKLSVDNVYRVEGLNYDEALQLFSLKAFKKHSPPIAHMRLSKRVIDYAQGNPLVLIVIGSALFGRNKRYWECALDKIEKFPKQKILAMLRVSYDVLSSDEQNIFLDIACFFNGEDEYHATKVLNTFRDGVYYSVTNLIDKGLITISRGNKLDVHHLLQEMAWAIVGEESVYPEERSRLHDPEDIYHILTKKKGTKAIQSIILDLSKAREMHLEHEAFVGMENLRLLKISGRNYKLHLGDLQFSSYRVRYLYWEAFPLKSLPSSFCVENLVKLSLPYSNTERLWTGAQDLVNLKWFDLTKSRNLIEIPDLSNANRIERIYLFGCSSLVTLHSSVQYLKKLEVLNLSQCEKLRYLPRRFESKFFRNLQLWNCPNIQNCPEILSGLEVLALSGDSIREVPSFDSFQHLKALSVYNCSSMTKFPQISSSIKVLELTGTTMEEVPPSIQSLTRLYSLGLHDNKHLLNLPTSISKLKSLRFLSLRNCPKLEDFPEILEPMERLRNLYLSGCENLRRLPDSISNLKSLVWLELSNCKFIRYLPKLPQSVSRLLVNNCVSLETFSCSKKGKCKYLRFTNCYRLDGKTREKIIALVQPTIQREDFVEIILPGSEIPKWFCHRSLGSSVTLQFPFGSNHLVGLTVCIVYEFIPFGSKRFSSNHFRLKCSAKDDTSAIFKGRDGILETLPEYATRSDHVLLYHLSTDYLNNFLPRVDVLSNCSEVSFEFYPAVAHTCIIKKCGVRLMVGESFCCSDTAEEYSITNDWEGSCKSMPEPEDAEPSAANKMDIQEVEPSSRKRPKMCLQD